MNQAATETLRSAHHLLSETMEENNRLMSEVSSTFSLRNAM